MLYEDRIKYCRVCLFGRQNEKNEMICGLTEDKPNFDGYCPNFQIQEDLKDIPIDIEPEEQEKDTRFFGTWKSSLFFLILVILKGVLVGFNLFTFTLFLIFGSTLVMHLFGQKK